MDQNTYGICERCEEEIPYPRLKARPVTTLCINCKTLEEQEEKSPPLSANCPESTSQHAQNVVRDREDECTRRSDRNFVVSHRSPMVFRTETRSRLPTSKVWRVATMQSQIRASVRRAGEISSVLLVF